LPYVDPSLPTLALVGAPNVGKSSLVRVLSSGVPEVCNYPFTTRSIKMGHFYIDAQRHQVGDVVMCVVILRCSTALLCAP
jgi:nucleolar GTP-binding protein